jgi:asparaginyl-tRNA synthetase
MRIVELMKQEPSDAMHAVKGWVKSKRESKQHAFIALNDGSCLNDFQIVVGAEKPGFLQLSQIQTGAAVTVLGKLVASQGQGQKVELLADQIQLHGSTGPSYPLQKKGHSLEFLREIAHLRARSNTFGSMFRLRHEMAMAVHDFFREEGFYWVHTPILTASDCEGAGEMFRVNAGDEKGKNEFFGKPAHLCVSGQLEAEALALGLSRVYTFGPTFRAENSNTTRHLSEFWMIEPELAFAELKDIADLAQGFLQFVFKRALQRCRPELEFFAKHYKNTDVNLIESLTSQAFTRMSYTQAIEVLQRSGQSFEFKPTWGEALQTEHERFLTDVAVKGPVIVHDYPRQCKAFYMRLNDDEKTVAAMDVLLPRVGEVIGGSQREERLEVLEAQMAFFGIPREDLEWYLDLRRFGTVPHGGFGAGFERLLLYVTGIGNIRDVIPFPRFPGNIAF